MNPRKIAALVALLGLLAVGVRFAAHPIHGLPGLACQLAVFNVPWLLCLVIVFVAMGRQDKAKRKPEPDPRSVLYLSR